MTRIALAVLLCFASTAQADSRAWNAAQKILPPDTQVVLGANIATIKNSALFQQLYPTLLAKVGPDAQAHLDAFKKTCNMDPLAKLDSVVIAVDDTQQGVAVVALKGATQRDVESCFQKAAAADKKTLSITTEDGLSKYTADKDVFYLRWLGKDTFAMATQPEKKDSLVKFTAGGDKTMKPIVAKLKTGSAVWFVSNQQQELDQFNAKAVRTYGSADIKGGNVNVDAHLVLDKPADQLAQTANQQLTAMKSAGGSGKLPPSLLTLVNTLKISSAGNELVITAAMPEKDLGDLVTMALTMSGGGAGSAMGSAGAGSAAPPPVPTPTPKAPTPAPAPRPLQPSTKTPAQSPTK